MIVSAATQSQAQPIAQLDNVLLTFGFRDQRSGRHLDVALVADEEHLRLHVEAPNVGTRSVDLVQLALAMAQPDGGKVL